MLSKKQRKTILHDTAARLLKTLAATPRFAQSLQHKPICHEDEYGGYYCAITKPAPIIGLPEFFLWIDTATKGNGTARATRIWAGFEFSGETKQTKFAQNVRHALELISTEPYGRQYKQGFWDVDPRELTKPFVESHKKDREYYFGQYDSAVIEKPSDALSAVPMAHNLLNRVLLVLQAQAVVSSSGQENDDDAQTTARAIRRGQAKFRKALLVAYGGKCAISRCSIESLLDAAHVKPHSKRGDYAASNGILLRTDLHTLFDEHLLNISPDNLHVELADELHDSEYKIFDGVMVRPPIAGAAISIANLRERYAAAKTR